MESRQACAVLLAGLAWASVAMAGPGVEVELPSCVAGSPPLRLAATAERALLDAPDRDHFHAAAQARYALYQRGGLAPAQVLLLRRNGQWQYLTLWKARRSGLCVSAAFAADRFDFTRRWIAKYQPQAADPDD